MDETIRTAAISPLRQRLIDDMNMRRFSPATQHGYIRDVGRFATFLGRSPDTATAMTCVASRSSSAMLACRRRP
jgi:integrase/recombinase XerD